MWLGGFKRDVFHVAAVIHVQVCDKMVDHFLAQANSSCLWHTSVTTKDVAEDHV